MTPPLNPRKHPEHHTPTVALFSDETSRAGIPYKRMVGTQCLHCNQVFSLSGDPSSPSNGRGFNRAHARRVLAAASGITKFREMLKRAVGR